MCNLYSITTNQAAIIALFASRLSVKSEKIRAWDCAVSQI